MCGIAGLARVGSTGDALASLVRAMCASIAHRGPDGEGITVDGEVGLGMRRLAIVDLERGRQPMLSDDGRIALVYNGEVYNAPALRRAMQARGVRFDTHSDTEVILRRYEEDPDTVEDELVGMWAFAIHDRRRNRLVVSRDRFGQKPLFWARGEGGAIAFGSELTALAVVAKDQRFGSAFALDPEAAHAMIAWSYVPEEATIHCGVTRLAPGTRVEVDLADGSERVRRYYRVRPDETAARVTSLGEACELIEPLLRRAVREHLESDVSVATFLSGGIDSSLVTAYAREVSDRPLEAFSIGFREPRFDESPFARRTAERLGVPIHVTMLDEEAAKHALADALCAYDEPFGDSSSLATYLLAGTVAKRHKVALGGDGGDEVFAGYRKHRIATVRDATKRVPFARAVLRHTIARLPKRTDRTNAMTDLWRTAARVAAGLASDDAEAYVALTQVGSLAKTAPLVVREASASRFVEPALARFRAATGTELQRTMASDLANPLPNDMLTKVDRATMAVGLEARVPFLDHRVVEAGLGLPARFTLGKNGKLVLRTLHRRKLGDALADRKKQGFGVPVERWLRGFLAPACDRLFAAERLERHGLLSARELGHGGWRRWAETDAQLLWHVFALAMWCERHAGGPEAVRAILV